MAARKVLAHSAEVRLRIKASQLINALQDRALGKNNMDSVAVQAARVVLAKAIPDLKAVEHEFGASFGQQLGIALKTVAKNPRDDG